MLNYRYDTALEFLQHTSNEELNFFVSLFKDSGNIAEILTIEEKYKEYYPNHKEYWELIVAELQYFGGNTFSNLKRGRGVLYKDILCDVCDNELISYDNKADVAQIEKIFVWNFLKSKIEQMSLSELNNFKSAFSFIASEELKLLNEVKRRIFSDKNFFENIMTDLVNSVGKSIFRQSIKATAPIVLQQVSSKIVGLPLGIVLGIKDVSDPAFRITLPSVLYIAYLREKYKRYDSIYRQRFYPKVGSIVRTELVGDLIDHSGIIIEKNEIVEIFNEDGKSIVKNVSYEEFVYGSSLRTGTAMYVAIDRLTKEVIFSTELANVAQHHIHKTSDYKLLEDNCHSFVYKCIRNLSFDKKVPIVLFDDLTKSISKHLNTGREVAWVVCDINPIEYKRKKTWRIEDEVV